MPVSVKFDLPGSSQVHEKVTVVNPGGPHQLLTVRLTL